MKGKTFIKAMTCFLLSEWLCTGAVHGQGMTSKTATGDVQPAQATAVAGAGNAIITPSVTNATPEWVDNRPFAICDRPVTGPSVYGGGEFLLLRTHFSEALAFVKTVDTLTPAGLLRQTQAEELNFAYDPSFRVFVGYQWTENLSLRATYWYFNTETTVSDGVASPNQFITDPLGNKAFAGQNVVANAGVRMNVYDLDLVRTFTFDQFGLAIQCAAGARLADIHQTYGVSTFTPGLAGAATEADFRASFLGAGPHLDVTAFAWGSGSGRLSLYGRAGAALLVGSYGVNAGATLPGARIEQGANRTLTVPVLEAEVGIAWRPVTNLTLSVGWQFQAWLDLGTSGGQFGGVFLPVDDANIMSFDGLVVRAQYRY